MRLVQKWEMERKHLNDFIYLGLGCSFAVILDL